MESNMLNKGGQGLSGDAAIKEPDPVAWIYAAESYVWLIPQ